MNPAESTEYEKKLFPEERQAYVAACSALSIDSQAAQLSEMATTLERIARHIPQWKNECSKQPDGAAQTITDNQGFTWDIRQPLLKDQSREKFFCSRNDEHDGKLEFAIIVKPAKGPAHMMIAGPRPRELWDVVPGGLLEEYLVCEKEFISRACKGLIEKATEFLIEHYPDSCPIRAVEPIAARLKPPWFVREHFELITPDKKAIKITI